MNETLIRILLELQELIEKHSSLDILVKAHSQLPMWSADSAVDCINAEIENFLSLCVNATVHCRIHTSVNEPLQACY